MQMADSTRRGFSLDDRRDFSGAALRTLRRAGDELYFLLNRGYPVKGASAFVGNHHLLSERQRVALTRVVAAQADIDLRRQKQLKPSDIYGAEVHIDGFNLIITLEVAMCGSPVFRCMDGTFRDLAGLRGTYRLIGKTDAAIRAVIERLQSLSVSRAVFWLDAPVSNSGRLKVRIAEIAEEAGFPVGIELVPNVDKVLYDLPNVVTGDSVILDRCPSWLNLNGILIPEVKDVWIVDVMGDGVSFV